MQPPLPLKYITGPVSYYGFTFTGRNGGNKVFHLFGDTHFSRQNDCQNLGKISCSNVDARVNSECQTITLLMDNMIKYCLNYGIQLDFFLEQGFNLFDRTRMIETRDDYIADLRNQFTNLLRKQKSVFNNIRVHYSDIRVDELDKAIDPFFILWQFSRLNLEYEVDRFFDFIFQKLFLTNLLDAFLNEDYNQRMNDIITLINIEIHEHNQLSNYLIILENLKLYFTVSKNASKLRKEKKVHFTKAEINKLREKNLRIILPQGIDKGNIADILEVFIFNKVRNAFNDTYKYMSQENSHANKLQSFRNMLLFMSNVVMDGYTLARLFFYSDMPGDQIITTYVGNRHNLNYVDFFLHIGLNPHTIMDIKTGQQGPIRCLENENFKNIFGYSSPL